MIDMYDYFELARGYVGITILTLWALVSPDTLLYLFTFKA